MIPQMWLSDSYDKDMQWSQDFYSGLGIVYVFIDISINTLVDGKTILQNNCFYCFHDLTEYFAVQQIYRHCN